MVPAAAGLGGMMGRSRVVGFALGAGMAVSAACTSTQIDSLIAIVRPAVVVGKGVVTGRVVDPTTQKPVAEAKVVVGTAKATTAPDGTYTATGLVPGTLFVKVDQPGYQSFFGEVQVTDGTTRFDIPIRPAPVPQPGTSAAATASDSPATPSDAAARPKP